jgi:anti-anti-sigma factor
MTIRDSNFREVDVANAPAFLAAMCEMIDWADNRAVVIDCAGITFMDSSAFHALVSAHSYAVERDRMLVISGLRSLCARVIRICDVQHVLTLADTSAPEVAA